LPGAGDVFQISDACVRIGLRVAVLVLRGVAIGGSGPSLRQRIAEAAAEVRRRFTDIAAIRDAPEVRAFTRIYESVGANPRRQTPSCQRLLESIWKRGDLPRINSLVDAYNLVSVESRLSLGAHDLGRVELPVHLRIVDGDEPFTPLGASRSGAVKSGEFAYVDARGRVICRLDHVQAEFSKVTERTSDALVIVEGTCVHTPDAFTAASHSLVELARQECGGSADVISEDGLRCDRPPSG
jgi:DNA/RNA-binding domain of Phe-tRNA-synthetase-like protein